MAERNKLASIPGQPMPERQSNFLSDLWDEASGAFARYGRRSGAQRDASLALMSQAADPNTDPLTGAGMKALGLAGLVTHPLAFFPTREEWDQRLQAAGNDSRIGRSIGGFLSDLPSLIDPQMAAGGAALAAAPIVGKLARPGLGKGLGELLQDAANNKELDALGARLQAEAAQVGGSPSTVSREQALQGLVGGAEDPGIIAYHGSPHSFDKFDMSKIGTGEGAQAYGHGLYFAENEKVAQGYRDALKGKVLVLDGLPVDRVEALDEVANRIKAAVPSAQQPYNSAKMLTEWMGSGYSPDQMRKRIAQGGWDTDVKQELNQVVDSLENGVGVKPNAGSTYQVKINVKPDELLDWDKPLSEQPKFVQDALKAGPTYQEHKGRDFYNSLVGRESQDAPRHYSADASEAWAEPRVSEKLKAAGIKGIRYKDAGSRGTDGGTYNYVVFDDKLITILKKYGIPMTAGAGGAMMVAGQDMPPEFASQMGGT